VIIVALLAIGQFETHEDLRFMDAQEAFVIKAKPGMTPPPPFYQMIERLGRTCHDCRERATDDLGAIGPESIRWLMWGRRHNDPEIRMRCESALAKATMCQWCRGTGCCLHLRVKPQFRGNARWELNDHFDWVRRSDQETLKAAIKLGVVDVECLGCGVVISNEWHGKWLQFRACNQCKSGGNLWKLPVLENDG
jgi:hypothetical protein